MRYTRIVGTVSFFERGKAMKPVSYIIPSWSGKVYRARKNYCCRNCGGMIPIGVQYLRHVERLGPYKGVDPVHNVHIHLDCQAPWYQPEMVHRLRSFGKLPGRLPPFGVYDGDSGYLRPAVIVSTPMVGTLQWQMPDELSQKLAFAPNHERAVAAVAEVQLALQIVLEALVLTAGRQKQSMQLSHEINEIALRFCHNP